MKLYLKSIKNVTGSIVFKNAIKLFLIILLVFPFSLIAQETTSEKKEHKAVRPTFESVWLIDNQSVIVNTKNTLEFDIMHRFGTLDNGYDDLYGFFAPSNIRLGFSYAFTDRLMLGFGVTKANFLWDVNLKYALLTQTRDDHWPLSITYFGDAAIDSRDGVDFAHGSDRFSYFHQLIFARKFSSTLSLQVAPSLSHFNIVPSREIGPDEFENIMDNDHFAIAFGGRYVFGSMAIIANYDQPITKHFTNNPHPNLSLGLEISTSSHAFQIFVSNYYNIIPQRNNVFNANDYTESGFLIGFNITRLWNY